MSENTNTITLKEFKMWLMGVEEMQDQAWVPNPAQWQRIREKINTIAETVVEATPQIPAYPVHRDVFPEPVSYPPLPAVPMTSTMLPSAPPGPPPHALFGNADMPTIPARTPSIDTADGNYRSSCV